jgi:hypothetical protein
MCWPTDGQTWQTLRVSFLQLFIENAPCNSNPATGALYKIGRFHIADQTDEDDLEGRWTECSTRPKQVCLGLTRNGWWWFWCLWELLSAVLALATMTQAAYTSQRFPVISLLIATSHWDTFRRAAVCNLHYTQLRKHDYSQFNVVLINLSKDLKNGLESFHGQLAAQSKDQSPIFRSVVWVPPFKYPVIISPLWRYERNISRQ